MLEENSWDNNRGRNYLLRLPRADESLLSPAKALSHAMEGREVLHDDTFREVVAVHVAQKSRWQVRRLSQSGCPVIIFFDEPALAGFGSSEFISISKEAIVDNLEEVIHLTLQQFI